MIKAKPEDAPINKGHTLHKSECPNRWSRQKKEEAEEDRRLLVILRKMWISLIMMAHPPPRSTNTALANTLLHKDIMEALARKIDTHNAKIGC